MRAVFLLLVLLTAACGRPDAANQRAQEEQQAQAAPAPSNVWFICDAIDAPALLLFEREGGTVRVSEYDKPNGAIVDRQDYAAGRSEGAAGSVYTSLERNGAEAGFVRQINPGVLETPGTAFTPPFTSVRLGQRDFSCRWLPRTRLMGFTGRRSVVVHEDADGDLIYTSYDFADAAAARAVELSENARTTTFSTEVRGGEERVNPQGEEFRFNTEDRYTYVVSISAAGEGVLQVLHNSAWTQTEPLIAYQQASGED